MSLSKSFSSKFLQRVPTSYDKTVALKLIEMSLYNNYYFDNCKIPTDTRGFRKSTYIYCSGSKYIVRADTPNVRGMHS